MLLSDRGLRAAFDNRAITVDPLGRRAVQPSSVDLRLGRLFRIFRGHACAAIDPRVRVDELTELVEVAEGDVFVMQPGEFVLGCTMERVAVGPRHAVKLEGRSSVGRLGLLVHATAGWIDPGFDGYVTLELANLNRLPFVLVPGMPIGQLCVFELSSPVEMPYGLAIGSRYKGQVGPTPSRLWMSWDALADPPRWRE